MPRKSVVRLTDRPDMTLDVYRGRKTTMQQQQQQHPYIFFYSFISVICKAWVRTCGIARFHFVDWAELLRLAIQYQNRADHMKNR